MKTIGLIGGLSWESTTEYYRIINQAVRQQLGGLHSAKIVLYSFDFEQIKQLQHTGQWAAATAAMVDAAQRVERAGADVVLICTNTMHKMADEVQAQIAIPLLHIADATADQIRAQGIARVGLLGTIFTMEETFYTDRLARYGLEVLTPPQPERVLVNNVIYNELCCGVIDPTSKQQYQQVISNLIDRGAQAIILGCTEITLLVDQNDSRVPVFDTTRIHAEAAVAFALAAEQAVEPVNA